MLSKSFSGWWVLPGLVLFLLLVMAAMAQSAWAACLSPTSRAPCRHCW